jgi:hypothetical protein
MGFNPLYSYSNQPEMPSAAMKFWACWMTVSMAIDLSPKRWFHDRFGGCRQLTRGESMVTRRIVDLGPATELDLESTVSAREARNIAARVSGYER